MCLMLCNLLFLNWASDENSHISVSENLAVHLKHDLCSADKQKYKVI